jgi:hypothetical protein
MADEKDKPRLAWLTGRQLRGEAVEEFRRVEDRSEKRANDVDRALLTISGGALALSLTFVAELASDGAECLWVLFVAWGCFALSIVAVIAAMVLAYDAARRQYIRQQQTLVTIENNPPDVPVLPTRKVNHARGVGIANAVALAGFIIGVTALFVFVGVNLLNESADRQVEQTRDIGAAARPVPPLQRLQRQEGARV